MHFDPELLKKKISQIAEVQQRAAFVPKKVINEAKKKRKADAEKAQREAEKRAKSIAQARKADRPEQILGDIKGAVKISSRPLDLTGKIAVRLDARTTIYANPGYDLEKLRAKYLRPFKSGETG